MTAPGSLSLSEAELGFESGGLALKTVTSATAPCQGYISSPCLFNLYAENSIENAGLEEAQTGIKIVRRIINNLRYADDTTLKAESEEELKRLLMSVEKECEKIALKLNV